jgi:hypothetical protein
MTKTQRNQTYKILTKFHVILCEVGKYLQLNIQTIYWTIFRNIAQNIDMEGVTGSIPVSSTNKLF